MNEKINNIHSKIDNIDQQLKESKEALKKYQNEHSELATEKHKLQLELKQEKLKTFENDIKKWIEENDYSAKYLGMANGFTEFPYYSIMAKCSKCDKELALYQTTCYYGADDEYTEEFWGICPECKIKIKFGKE